MVPIRLPLGSIWSRPLLLCQLSKAISLIKVHMVVTTNVGVFGSVKISPGEEYGSGEIARFKIAPRAQRG